MRGSVGEIRSETRLDAIQADLNFAAWKCAVLEYSYDKENKIQGRFVCHSSATVHGRISEASYSHFAYSFSSHSVEMSVLINALDSPSFDAFALDFFP